jgi:hypothetical protein
VLGQTHAVSGTPELAKEPWNFSNAYGISIYLPLGEKDCRPSGLPRIAGGAAEISPSKAPSNAPSNFPVVEPQLDYYKNPDQLAFIKQAPNWAALIKWFYDNTNIPVRDLQARPFHSPFQMRTNWRVVLPAMGGSDDNPSAHFEIQLRTGWNLFAYPLQNEMAVVDALRSIEGNYTMITTYDPTDPVGPWLVYEPDHPERSNMHVLKPHYGYWINVRRDVILRI